MCIQLVERYGGCGCLYFEHSIDPCSAINTLGHEIQVKEVPVSYTCSKHTQLGDTVSELADSIYPSLVSDSGNDTPRNFAGYQPSRIPNAVSISYDRSVYDAPISKHQDMSNISGPVNRSPSDIQFRDNSELPSKNKDEHNTSSDSGMEIHDSFNLLADHTASQPPKFSIQSNEAANLANKAFIQDPDKYWARVHYLKELVYDIGRESIKNVVHPAQYVRSERASLDWLASAEQFCRNKRMECQNGGIFLLQVLLRRNLDHIEGIIRVLKVFSHSGFSAESYSIIAVDLQRTGVLRLTTITLDDLTILKDLLDAALLVVSRNIEYRLANFWADIEGTTSSLEAAVTSIMSYLELDVFPTERNPLCDTTLLDLADRLELVSLAVSVLFFGLLSYIHGHTGGLDEIIFGESSDYFVIHVATRHMTLARYRLGCLHEFLGGPVWAFKCTSQVLTQEHKTFYLATSLADFDDLWGPLCLHYTGNDRKKIVSISTRAGSLRKVNSNVTMAKDVSREHGEILCHWKAWTDDTVISYTDLFPDEFQNLLIGLPVAPARLQTVIESPPPAECGCRVVSSQSYEKFILGTERHFYQAEGRTAQLGVSKWISLNLSQTWKVHPGLTVKDVIANDWADPNHKHPEPEYLDWYTVIETSQYTGHSQRISLWGLIKCPGVLNYVQEKLGKDFWKLCHLHQQSSFQQTWKSARSDSRIVLKETIGLLLGKLLKTGVKGNELLLWDVSSYSGTHVGPIGRIFRPRWYHLAKDSDSTATFAVLTDSCFDHPQQNITQWPWNVISSSRWFDKVLYTEFCVNTYSRNEFSNQQSLGQDQSLAPKTSGTGSPDYSSWKLSNTGGKKFKQDNAYENPSRDTHHVATRKNSDESFTHLSGPVEEAEIGAKDFTQYAGTRSATRILDKPDILAEVQDRTTDNLSRTRDNAHARDMRDKQSEYFPRNQKQHRVQDRRTALTQDLRQIKNQSQQYNRAIAPTASRGIHTAPRRSPYQEAIEASFAPQKHQESALYKQTVSEVNRVKPSRVTQKTGQASAPQPTHSDPDLSLFGKDLPILNNKGRPIGKLRLRSGSKKSPVRLDRGSSQEGICADWQAYASWKAELGYWVSRVEDAGESLESAYVDLGPSRNGDFLQASRVYGKEVIRNERDRHEWSIGAVIK